MAKMFEDALRAIGVLEDDDPRHVARAVIEVASVAGKKKEKDASPAGGQVDEEREDWVEIEINSL